ncbi:family 16 glycosylhydrolase [Dysgonomonas sp. 511]|uniref:glycoside hydrolase family 16 protein n=1 Tax=Dysgonomonas sp. 511 TaxID=2302930 RepID=UPI001C8886F9|nr:glycoside hydrolase family 16 protein [Dysgonomonas sp. 511]
MFLLSFFIILFACSGSNDGNPPKEDSVPIETGSGETDGYKLVWEDLFQAPELDNSKWAIEVYGDGSGNRELQYYLEKNISLGLEPVTKKSSLIITARKENHKGQPATSGRITTQNKYEFTHGKVEASIKLPGTANGLWPAFWLLGADFPTKGWPACGEIDILEMGHGNGIKNNIQDKYFNGALHWGPDWNGGAYPNYAKDKTADYSLQDDFHLYTLIWDESTIRMYLDIDKHPGTSPYFEMDIKDKTTDTSSGNYFHKDFFIILNLAVGGNFPQIWDINKVTAFDNGDAKMYVDFVKVYKKTD